MKIRTRKNVYIVKINEKDFIDMLAQCTKTAMMMLIVINSLDPDYQFPTCDEYYDHVGYAKKEITKTKRFRYKEATEILARVGVLVQVKPDPDPVFYISPNYMFAGTHKHRKEQFDKLIKMREESGLGKE